MSRSDRTFRQQFLDSKKGEIIIKYQREIKYEEDFGNMGEIAVAIADDNERILDLLGEMIENKQRDEAGWERPINGEECIYID